MSSDPLPFGGTKTEDDVKTEPKPSKKKEPKKAIFLWPRPLMRRTIVLEQKREEVTAKGVIPVAGSGKSIMVEYGVYETEDKKIIDALRKHPSYEHANKGRTFREATEQERGIIEMLKGSKIAQEELMRRMRAIISAQDPSKKIVRG